MFSDHDYWIGIKRYSSGQNSYTYIGNKLLTEELFIEAEDPLTYEEWAMGGPFEKENYDCTMYWVEGDLGWSNYLCNEKRMSICEWKLEGNL